ncbi:MAG: arylesterase [Verrucomicrobiota bacterium]|nr:arylesterase [Verrucomicrobiota bacterium]
MPINRLIPCSAVATFVFFAAMQSGDGARREASGVRTILMLGDSLTDGYGVSRSQAYPALIAERIRAANLPYEVVNAGVSGDTTAGGLRRIPKYLERPVDVLVLELGINDAFRGIPLEQMRANLQAIIERVKAKNPHMQVVIAGMQLPLYGADDYVRAFGEMFGELAEKNHAALVPYLLLGVGGDPSLNIGDRIHPNAAGQRVLAETVWRVLEPVLRGATAATAKRVE